MSTSPQAPAEMPPLILTMGDPAGIGPEIVIKAAMERRQQLNQWVVAGDMDSLRRALRTVQGTPASVAGGLVLSEIERISDLAQVPAGCLAVIQACQTPLPVRIGCVSAEAGLAAAECIRFAAQAVLTGAGRAMVTAPIHKEALHAAGLDFPGHTEYLQALAASHAGVTVEQMPVRMMLSCPGLRTVLVSIHVALSDAIAAVSQEAVLQTLRITAAHFRRCGLPKARIAVAGLNPHAGEAGLFGREEIESIAPAVSQAQQEGLTVSGPWAPDTVFMRARQGEFDVVIAMYHDQGLIPVKLLGLDHGVNTTLGLPLVRTSPDHGTAFDLAGTGLANASSLLAAIDAATEMTATAQTPSAT